MASTERCFWTALESVPGLSAVTSEWRSHLGPDFEAARKYLRPNGRLAGAIACPFNACGCAHDVVQHGPDDFVTVCRCEPRECSTAAISRADLALFEIDRRGLGGAIAAVIKVTPEHLEIAGLPMTWSIGTFTPRAGFRFPVYLTIQIEPTEYQQVLEALLGRAEGPFLVATPTRDFVRRDMDDGLHRRHGHLLVLGEDLVLRHNGSFELRRPLPEVLDPFLAVVLPGHTPGRGGEKVPTFRQNGDHWKIWFEEVETTIKDGVGPRYLALLLANPGESMHVIDMQLAEATLSGRVEASSLPWCSGDPDEAGFDVRRTPATSGGPAADRLAVRKCRARLEEIDQALANAEAAGAPVETVELREEAGQINRYISSVLDLRGRPRPSADDDERVRQSVTKAIRRAIGGLSKKHPNLARHLRKHLEMGFTCLYHPDPPVVWVTR